MLAIRSSTQHEDNSKHSFAGVYQTVLRISGLSNIFNAIECAVIQYYSYTALSARMRIGNFMVNTDLNIIIQEMIEGEIAGVCFCNPLLENENERIRIEWVYGIGDSLVSGESIPNEYCAYNEYHGEYSDVLKLICEISYNIYFEFNFPVDIEWAYCNGRVYILQVRNITAPLLADNFYIVPRGVIWQKSSLYFDDSFEESKLLDCKNIYNNYRNKRAVAYRLAKDNNIKIGNGYILLFSLAGLRENKEDFDIFIQSNFYDKIVLDISDTIRQVVICSTDLFEYIVTTFSGDNSQPRTIIVRQFISGEAGCISNIVDDSVLIEYSQEGLMAINRGQANCQEIIISSNGKLYFEVENEILTKEIIRDITRFTTIISTTQKCSVEWSISNGKAYFIDFSCENSLVLPDTHLWSDGIKVIVQGYALGNVIFLSDDLQLRRLSDSPGVSVGELSESLRNNSELRSIVNSIKMLNEKPIIWAKRPYAILSFLFDYVSGFVFSGGGLLCHLSILLRENQIPSLIAPNIDFDFSTNLRLLINGSQLSIIE